MTPQAEAGDKTWSVGRYGVVDFPDYLVQPLITALCEVLAVVIIATFCLFSGRFRVRSYKQ